MGHAPSAFPLHDAPEEGAEVAIGKERVGAQPIGNEEDDPSRGSVVCRCVSVQDSDHRRLKVDVKHGEEEYDVN